LKFNFSIAVASLGEKVIILVIIGRSA